MAQVAHQLTGDDFDSAEDHGAASDLADVPEIQTEQREHNTVRAASATSRRPHLSLDDLAEAALLEGDAMNETQRVGGGALGYYYKRERIEAAKVLADRANSFESAAIDTN